jgi:UDP-N-acetylglucosamine 2-epimerase
LCEKDKIIFDIQQAISEDFRDSLKGLKNPYGDGGASGRIVEVLKEAPLENIVRKEFQELKVLKRG